MSTKISEFIGITSVDDDGVLTVVQNGQNFKISQADYLAQFGVTGTIVQEGDPTATPVLDTQGTVNNIRNFEDGSGFKAAVSAQNGVILDHNFIQDATGVAVLTDITATQPKFRSLLGGAGINVAGSNGSIQIALSAIPVSTKTVIVNQLSDFPAAVAGIITLCPDTEYAVRNDITTSSRFVWANNVVISGSDSAIVALTYTGAGTMFTSVDNVGKIKGISLNYASGTLLAVSGTGVEIFQILDCVLNGATLGTMSGLAGIQLFNIQYIQSTDGLVFSGTNGVIYVDAMLNTATAGTILDFDTSVFSEISINNCFNILSASAVFLDGAASSANINSGGLGSVHSCRFLGAGTPMQTITVADILWQFSLNDVLQDTTRDVLMSQIGNATPTILSGSPTKLLGTWVEEDNFFFTTDATGKMTYIGIKDAELDVTMSFSGEPVSGSNKAISYYVAKNGTEIANSAASANISAADPKRVTVIWRVSLSTGEYIEAFVKNSTDNISMLTTDAVMRIS